MSPLRLLDYEMNPWTHLEQPGEYGCIYYAMASITGDKGVIPEDDVLRELNLERMRFRLQNRYFLGCEYHDEYRPVSQKTWRRLRKETQRKEKVYVPLLITVWSNRNDGTQHAVGLALYQSHVVVLNPSKEYAMSLSWTEFLKSRYAKAMSVWWVNDADVGKILPCFLEDPT